ncbi:MAG: 6-bladed beta-propeller [Prevotellaceae bacterium]|jgi:hypothetical protein|nr:6-bladed beta-propeller [Prevotellaceae bacterium]
MKTSKIYIPLFLIVFFGSSCSNKITFKQSKSVYVEPTNVDSIDSFFEDWYYVTLETTANNLIASIDKIQIDDDYMWLLDTKNSSIYTFDLSGKYIRKLCRLGNGPEEYLDIADFQVFNNHIYILSRSNKTIFIYNLSGAYIGNYKLDDWYDYFYMAGHSVMLYSNFSNNTLYNLIEFNPTSEQYGKKEFPFPRNQGFRFIPSPFIITDNKDLLFAQQYDYTIYSLEPNTMRTDTVATLYFNTKDKLPENPYAEDFFKIYREYTFKSVVKRISMAYQKDNILYVMYVLDYVQHLTKINMTSGENVTLKLEHNDKYPYVFSQPLTVHHQYLVSSLDASSVLLFDDKFKSDKNTGGFLTEDDNPVLFFNKLKHD